MKKGSKEAKAWGRKMQRARSGKVYKSHSVKSFMVKRKRTKTRHSRRGTGNNSLLKTAVIGGGLTMLYELYLSSKIPISNPTTKNLVEAGAGYFLSKKSGMLGDFGKILLIENVYSLMVSNVAPMVMGGITTSSGGSAY